MKRLKVSLKKRIDCSYDIVIGEQLFSFIAQDLQKKKLGNRYLIISDSRVQKLYGDSLLDALRKAGLQVDLVAFPSGEQHKNLSTVLKLIEKAHALKLDRRSAIISLGGGVVGDVAGYVAASYMRGIPYVGVPTTLLAMVDSSIGGKVGVDIVSGKNMVGAFHQPRQVYIDVGLLKKLPLSQLRNGLAELVKHGFIRDAQLVRFIHTHVPQLLAKDTSVLMHAIEKSCSIKARIVEEDEQELGKRQLLNYGHTVGHALETLTHYKKYDHGEAIALGMVVAARLSHLAGSFSSQEVATHNEVLAALGLPTKFPKVTFSTLYALMQKDKKAVQGKIGFVFLGRIGKARYGVSVEKSLVHKALELSLASGT